MSTEGKDITISIEIPKMSSINYTSNKDGLEARTPDGSFVLSVDSNGTITTSTSAREEHQEEGKNFFFSASASGASEHTSMLSIPLKTEAGRCSLQENLLKITIPKA